MPIRPHGTLAVAMLLLSSWAAAQNEPGLKIVVNPTNTMMSLSKADVSRLFLRRSATWADGQPAFPVNQADGTALRQAFSTDVLGISPASAAQQVSERGGTIPALATDRDVLAYVRLKPGAIGYVSASAPAQGVKAFAVNRTDDLLRVASVRALITVGDSVPAPAKVHDVAPIYPTLARERRVTGEVELDIVVGESGTVDDARVLRSSSALLTEAAVEAVRKWRYAPTQINGAPVPVRMTVRVNFVL